MKTLDLVKHRLDMWLVSLSSFKFQVSIMYLHQVIVDNGTRLTEGKVSETCEAAGMRAVCSGPSSCKYTNVAKCVITPLSSNCNNPM